LNLHGPLASDALRPLTEPAAHGVGVWILALVFAWSGIVKLQRPGLAAMAMVDFGVLNRMRPRLGLALGLFEVVLALALSLGVLLRPSLFLATLALWLFTALIARSLWLGEHFACFCFGDTDSRISSWTLVRTAALTVLASVLVLLPPAPLATAATVEVWLLQAVAATSLIGTIVLASCFRRLLEWNRDPLGIGETARQGGE
jgi:hypothetical protein